MKLFKKDTFINGIIIGILLPGLIFGIFYQTVIMVRDHMSASVYENVFLLLIAINGIVMRHFMVKREQDWIGRGILAITFVYIFAWVIKYQL